MANYEYAAGREVRAGVRAALLAAGVELGRALRPTGEVEALIMGEFPEGTTVRGLEVNISEEP